MFAVLFMLVVGGPEASACGNEAKWRVVGWTGDGAKALIRSEHNDDEGQIHQLNLYLLSKSGVEKKWDILTVKDNSDQSVRSRRWKAAEPEIAAAGIKLDPSRPPLVGETEGGGCLDGDLVSIPDKPYSLMFDTHRETDSMSRMLYDLLVVTGETKKSVRVLFGDYGYGGMGFCVGSYWTDPANNSVVVVPGYGSEMALVPMTEIEAALAAPPL